MDEAQDLASKLTTSRIITLVVGPDDESASKTFKIQEALLTERSEFFVKALSYANWGKAEQDVLRLPADNVQAWTVLIYWMLKGELPQTYSWSLGESKQKEWQKIWVHCWSLGDKYNIPDFQDLAMLELLHIASEPNVLFEFDTIALALANSPPKSVLRDLMAGEIARGLHQNAFKIDDLDALDGTAGVMSAVVRAQEEKMHVAWEEYPESWENFMVGEGPTQHWVWEEWDRMDGELRAMRGF